MIIDFHTHSFPAKIASRALEQLSASGGVLPHTDGTNEGLRVSMKASGIDYSVLLPVVTSPKQTDKINDTAFLVNETSAETGLLSFGGIHPDNDNYREILQKLADHHVKGIKLHPAFYQTDFDDIRFARILDCACSHDLIVVTHAGIDISFLDHDYCSPTQIKHILQTVQPQKLVLAHMGGWQNWDEVVSELAGEQLYLDTSFSLTPLLKPSGPCMDGQMAAAFFLQMVQIFGADHILFGSDSPWSDQKASLDCIRNSGAKPDEVLDILGKNAEKLLQLSTI